VSAKEDGYMRELYREERFAMAFWHEEYGSQTRGAIDFYADLYPREKALVDRILAELEKSKPMPRRKQ